MSNFRVSVSGVKLLDPNDVLKEDRRKEEDLAPPPDPVIGPAMLMEPELEAPVDLAPPAPAPLAASAPAQLPIRDYTADLARAQEQARRTRLIAGIGQAGQTAIDASSGIRSGDAFQDMAAGADQPLKDLQARMSLEAAADKARAGLAASDPNSRENRSAQALFLQAFPTFARRMGSNLSGMTAKDLEQWTKVGHQADELSYKDKSLGAMTDHRRALDENSDLMRQQRAREFNAELTIKQQDADSRRINALKAPQSATLSAAQNAIGGRHIDNALIGFNAKTEKLRGLYSLLAEADRIAPGITRGKVPEGVQFGPVEAIKRQLPQGFGANFSKADDVKLNSILQKFITQVRHDTAGASLTGQERADYVEIFQQGLLAPAGVKAALIDSFRRDLHNKYRSVAAAYARAVPADVWDQYYADGGIGPRSPAFGDLQPRPQAAPPAAAGSAPALPTSIPVREPRPRKGYSPGENKTYIYGPDGQLLGIEVGDTRGR